MERGELEESGGTLRRCEVIANRVYNLRDVPLMLSCRARGGMADTMDLGSIGESCAGSSPVAPTNLPKLSGST